MYSQFLDKNTRARCHRIQKIGPHKSDFELKKLQQKHN